MSRAHLLAAVALSAVAYAQAPEQVAPAGGLVSDGDTKGVYSVTIPEGWKWDILPPDDVFPTLRFASPGGSLSFSANEPAGEANCIFQGGTPEEALTQDVMNTETAEFGEMERAEIAEYAVTDDQKAASFVDIRNENGVTAVTALKAQNLPGDKNLTQIVAQTVFGTPKAYASILCYGIIDPRTQQAATHEMVKTVAAIVRGMKPGQP